MKRLLSFVCICAMLAMGTFFITACGEESESYTLKALMIEAVDVPARYLNPLAFTNTDKALYNGLVSMYGETIGIWNDNSIQFTGSTLGKLGRQKYTKEGSVVTFTNSETKNTFVSATFENDILILKLNKSGVVYSFEYYPEETEPDFTGWDDHAYVWTEIDGTHIRIDRYKGIDSKVNVPNTMDGLPVKEIAAAAFKDVTWLTEVVIPDSIVEIGSGVFEGCSSLSKVTVPFIGRSRSSVDTPFAYMFKTSANLLPTALKEVVITDANNIEPFTFKDCEKIEKIILNEGIITIGESAFLNCKALKKIDLPISVEEVGAGAFKSCTFSEISLPYIETTLGYYFGDALDYLKKVTVTKETTISEDAFKNCNRLVEIVIGNTVTKIEANSFKGTSSLEKLTLPFVGKQINEEGTAAAVFGYIFGTESFDNSYKAVQKYTTGVGGSSVETYIPSSLTKITLTNAVRIPYGAFDNCKEIEEIYLPASLTQIGSFAFHSCDNLRVVTIEESSQLVTIKSNAFERTISLESFNLEEATLLDEIEANVFMISGITSLIIPVSVTRVGSSAFSECSNLVIYVENAETFATSNWNVGWKTGFEGEVLWYGEW